MDGLWPTTGFDESRIEEFYAYPPGLDRPWVRVNFVSSVDGAVTVAGRSRGLSTPADHRVFQLGRDLADVVLVGLGTALVEGYGGVPVGERRTERRRRLGLPPVPPIAVVTGRCAVPLDSPLLTDTAVPPLVFTCASAPETARREVAEAGAEVIIAGEDRVDLHRVLAELGERGLHRVDCEGGPKLFGTLIEEDLVDELCLTLSPLLVGGDAGRIATGALPVEPRALSLVSVLHEDDALLLRYGRGPGSPVG
ncbi:pyrimidine reductase family protein [Allokutzneria albata]|uniref:5-amino-6-(5-phosphoribosylamino)uracil reductase n=1 Tax=Allokutzneria albata TaxID=211114 RepID=A0A1G9WLH9_ALLAB|nr:pyrimidine reductase family protein [Allokutzneria albata]SDM85398.1 5-amino-6-(5-phosphoribosylamino)uracil reductase [Allokutzneria albata]